MCAVLVVVANILKEPPFQVAFVNCDDVIQEITPATPYPTLCDSILPRTFERSAECWLDAAYTTQMRLETSTSGNTRHRAIQVANKICLWKV